MRTLVQRAWRYGMVGAFCTLVSYVAFVSLVDAGLNFMAANVTAWAAGVVFGFALNRRVTFQIRGREGLPRQLALFAAGSVTQLLLSCVGFALLIGVLRLEVNLAFAINLGTITLLMFAYLNLVAFRTRRTARAAHASVQPAG